MSRKYLLRLNWPDKALSSNGRVHWAQKARATATARTEAHYEAKARGLRDPMPNAMLRFTYYPPDRRKRDAHNLPTALKAHIDGIADAMGCEDSGFQCVFPGGFDEPCKGGAVLVEISENKDISVG